MLFSTLYQQLCTLRFYGKLVPHYLTIHQNLTRKHHLNLSHKYKTHFENMDKSWVYHHDRKLEQELLQRTEAGCSAQKQVKSERLAKLL